MYQDGISTRKPSPSLITTNDKANFEKLYRRIPPQVWWQEIAKAAGIENKIIFTPTGLVLNEILDNRLTYITEYLSSSRHPEMMEYFMNLSIYWYENQGKRGFDKLKAFVKNVQQEALNGELDYEIAQDTIKKYNSFIDKHAGDFIFILNHKIAPLPMKTLPRRLTMSPDGL